MSAPTLPLLAAVTPAESVLDTFSGTVVPLLLKIALITVMFLVVPLVGGYLEHKGMARLQNRAAPSRPARPGRCSSSPTASSSSRRRT